MAVVNCSKCDCVENIAGECVRKNIFLIDDGCQCYIKGTSTGEIIETEEDHERD